MMKALIALIALAGLALWAFMRRMDYLDEIGRP